MEISKSTPYVRYRENISSTLHKGTIHIESEYLDRERKTTIESIEGQTWQNMVNGENKEEDILPRLGMKIEGNEDVLDTIEQHMPIDTIIGDVEPVANEDGTYTYEISTMEGSYAKTLDGENNFSLTSDGLVGDMYIKYNAQGEEVNGNIVMNGQSSYTIENSNIGKIKSATLKGKTMVNIFNNSLLFGGSKYVINQDGSITMDAIGEYTECNFKLSSYIGKTVTIFIIFDENSINVESYNLQLPIFGFNKFSKKENRYLKKYVGIVEDEYLRFGLTPNVTSGSIKFKFMAIEGDFLNQDVAYFQGITSVENPTIITSNSPIQFGKGGRL